MAPRTRERGGGDDKQPAADGDSDPHCEVAGARPRGTGRLSAAAHRLLTSNALGCVARWAPVWACVKKNQARPGGLCGLPVLACVQVRNVLGAIMCPD